MTGSARTFVPSVLLAFVIALALVVANCGGSIGPTTPTGTSTGTTTSSTSTVPPVTAKSIAVQGTTTGTAGSQFQLTGVVTFSDGTTQDVTSQASWSSTNNGIATISGAGLLALVAAGECDVRVSWTQASTSTTVTATVHVVATPRVQSSTWRLFGLVEDSISGAGLGGVNVTITDGPNAGHSNVSDPTGYYSIPSNVDGTFNVRYSRSGYETLDSQVTIAGGDTNRNQRLRPLGAPAPTTTTTIPGATQYAGTYAVTLTTTKNTCSDITPGTSGTVVLSGPANGLTVTMTERGITRTYKGTIAGDGTFSAGGVGITNIIYPHEFTGNISGKSTGTSISGTEGLTITLGCPGGTATITTTFSGPKIG
jgi:hypothetical protein